MLAERPLGGVSPFPLERPDPEDGDLDLAGGGAAELKHERLALDLDLHALARARAIDHAPHGKQRQAGVALHRIDPGLLRQDDTVAPRGNVLERDDAAVAAVAAALRLDRIDDVDRKSVV